MERIPYIAARRARFQAIGGPVNIPYGTAVEAVDGFLERDGLPLCAVTSEHAHQFFARNDDGRGLERGKLAGAIVSQLSRRDKEYQTRWDRVWASPVCQKYRREEYADRWLWSHAFYEAPVEDLERIAALAGVKGARA